MEDQRWSYWSNRKAIPEDMVLSNDPLLHSADLDELLDYVPPFTGASVLELGCGIGRFTGKISAQAHDVTAVDLVDKFLDVCREDHGHLTNVTIICQDILKLELEKVMFDVVFSGWMYANLSQSESVTITRRVLEWLRPGGTFIFRECGPEVYCSENPGYYRSPLLYEQLVHSVQVEGYKFNLTHFKNSRTFITFQGDVSEVYFVAQKVSTGIPPKIQEPVNTFESFPFPTLKEQDFKTCGVITGSQVLVLGCGSGGLVFHLARTFSATVLGVDPSPFAINTAIHYQHGLDQSVLRLVQFEMSATEDAEFNAATFDVIFLGVSNLRLAQCCPLVPRLRGWVKSGGKIYIIDESTLKKHTINIEVTEVIVVGCADDDPQQG